MIYCLSYVPRVGSLKANRVFTTGIAIPSEYIFTAHSVTFQGHWRILTAFSDLLKEQDKVAELVEHRFTMWKIGRSNPNPVKPMT